LVLPVRVQQDEHELAERGTVALVEGVGGADAREVPVKRAKRVQKKGVRGGGGTCTRESRSAPDNPSIDGV
jgi:hypothetical protein